MRDSETDANRHLEQFVERRKRDVLEPNIDPDIADFGLFKALMHPLTLLSAAAVAGAMLWIVWAAL